MTKQSTTQWSRAMQDITQKKMKKSLTTIPPITKMTKVRYQKEMIPVHLHLSSKGEKILRYNNVRRKITNSYQKMKLRKKLLNKNHNRKESIRLMRTITKMKSRKKLLNKKKRLTRKRKRRVQLTRTMMMMTMKMMMLMMMMTMMNKMMVKMVKTT